MELIIIMGITNIIIIAIAFISMMIIFDRLANKLLQIEIIKKAETFKEAKDFGKRDLGAEQKLEKKIVDEQEKAFLEAQKKSLSHEEKQKLEEEAEWLEVK